MIDLMLTVARTADELRGDINIDDLEVERPENQK